MGEKEKLAIISSGGGMKCSFGAGVMLALTDKFDIHSPDILICGSGSAGTGTYWITQEYEAVREVWSNLLATKEMVDYKRVWKIIDIDHLVDDIFKNQHPFDEDLLYNHPITEYLIPALDRQTGNIEYFANDGSVDFYEAMRATKSLPIFSELNPKVQINGSSYCDSYLSSRVDSHYKTVVEKGATKILVIDNSPPELSSLYHDRFFRLWMYTQFNIKEQYYQNREELLSYKIPEHVDVFTLQPDNKLPVHTLNNDREALEKTLNYGYKKVIKNKKLEQFLSF